MRQVSVEVAGKVQTAFVQKIGETLWVHLDGETFTFEPETSKRSKRKKSGGGGSASDVHAPMPGKITKINVRESDKVSEGQVLVVLEAMKMEYTLKTPLEGKVKSINCKVGDQVALGQLLVAIEPKATK